MEVRLYDGQNSNVGGLLREPNGSLTEIHYRRVSPYDRLSTTPNANSTFYQCTTLGTRNPSPFSGTRMLPQPGVTSTHPIATDLRGDGTYYIAIGDTGKQISVYRYDPNSTTSSRTTQTLVDPVASIAVGDFNGDGKRDLAALHNEDPGRVSILLGNGDGTFQTANAFPVGSPYSEYAAPYDLNGDGRTDLVVASYTNLVVLLANANGSLQAPLNITSGNYSSTMVTDVNGDGKPDVLATSFDGLFLLRGNGGTSFQAPVAIPTNLNPSAVASGDLNKDGKMDLAVLDRFSSVVAVLTGDGNGNFTLAGYTAVRAAHYNIMVTDFDRDGNQDVVLGSGHPDGVTQTVYQPTAVTVLIGKGDGTLYGPDAYKTDGSELVSGDFNADGRVDLVTAGPGSLKVYLASASGKFNNQTTTSLRDGDQTLSASGSAVGDFNKDGKLDVAIASGPQQKVYILFGNGNGTFQSPVGYAAGEQPSGLAVGDVNGDGTLDIVAGQFREDISSVRLLLGGANGTFQAPVTLNTGINPRSVLLEDVNADGRFDLITVNNGMFTSTTSPGNVSLLIGNGNGTFQTPVNYAAGLNPQFGYFGDVNGDGRKDLVVTTQQPQYSYRVATFLNNGNGTFQAAQFTTTDFGPYGVAFADINNDGKTDLFVSHCCGDTDLTYMLGNGNGTFQSEVHMQSGASPSVLLYRDVNGDAKPDLITLNASTSSRFITVSFSIAGLVGPVCTYGVTTQGYTVGSQAGTLTGSLTASAASCAWAAFSAVNWATILPELGSGSKDFTITVQANNTGSQRSGQVEIGGQIITITQTATTLCTYTLSSTSYTAPVNGAASTVTVTTASGCAWSITGLPAWATVQSPASLSASGTATVSFTVASNGGPARSASLSIGGQTFTLAQAGTAPPGGMRFVPLPPCRLMETRAIYNFEGRTGAFGPPNLTAGQTRTMNVPQSNVCSVPASAKAYVLNVTLIPVSGGVSFVTLYPAGAPQPNVWTVRSPDGQIVANSNIIAAGNNGGISVFTSEATDLLLDIAGYFTDEQTALNLVYYPLTPCRVIDTRALYRPQPGPFGPPSMTARETRKFRFPSTPYCNIPQAAAYSFTITAVPPASLAYLTAWPDGSSQPNVSSINSFAGRVLANSVIIPASGDGTIDFFAYDATDFIVDINGYFAPDNGSTGLYYFPVTQCRANDSTNGAPYANESTRTINIPNSGCTGIPANAQAYALNVTALPAGNPMPFITAFPTGQPQPNASILNAFQGQVVTNSAIIPAGTGGAVNIYAYRQTHVVVEVNGYFGR
ncbi:MAG: VCBS repeat-containing protein [Acidobacteria bacterium]|nr:VCBS repeat-containing protein [Acidobacteriota bacterium]